MKTNEDPIFTHLEEALKLIQREGIRNFTHEESERFERLNQKIQQLVLEKRNKIKEKLRLESEIEIKEILKEKININNTDELFRVYENQNGSKITSSTLDHLQPIHLDEHTSKLIKQLTFTSYNPGECEEVDVNPKKITYCRTSEGRLVVLEWDEDGKPRTCHEVWTK